MTAVLPATDQVHEDHRRQTGTGYPDAANADLLSRIPMDAGTILDVGCGTGALGAAYRALNSAARLLGIERDPEMAAIARQRLDAVACVDVQQDALPFDLPEGIDCLIYGDVLQQLRDPWTVLRRQLEALNPGGSVLVCVANAEHWSMVARLLRGNWHYEPAGLLDVHHLRWFSLRNVMRELVDAGLAVEEVHPRIFAPEHAQQFVQTLAPGLRRLGIDPGGYLPRAMPLQYVLRARRAGSQTTTASAAESTTDQSGVAILEEETLIETDAPPPVAGLGCEADQGRGEGADPESAEELPLAGDATDTRAKTATKASDEPRTSIVLRDATFVSRSLLSMTETVELERLRDMPCSRAVLAPADKMDMPPCYVMNPPSAPLSLSDTPHNRIFPRQMRYPEMWVARLDDVYYLPFGAPFLPDSGILINDFLVPSGPDAIGWFKYEGECTYRLPMEIDLKEAQYVDTAFFMGHPVSGHFGHFVGDCLSRMHAWQHCRELFGDAKIILDHAPHGTRFRDRLLAAAGVKPEDIIFAQGVIRCSKLLFASTALGVLRYASPTSAKLWQQIRDAFSDSPAQVGERIYLSRSAQSTRKLINEPEVEELFGSFGFSIVHPEELSIEEQVSMVSNAQLVAGPTGAAMSSLAFQRGLQSALILVPETFVTNSEWLLLAGARCPVYYHFGLRDMPPGSPVSGGDVWRVDLSRLASDIASWLWAGPATSPTKTFAPKVAMQSALPVPNDVKETVDRSRSGGGECGPTAEGRAAGGVTLRSDVERRDDVGKYRVVIVACARWETDSIIEWATYHRQIGFDHIYLYCNDDDPTELYERVLPLAEGDEPFISFTHFPFQGMQARMYKHFLQFHSGDAEWLIFLDIDEFVVIKNGNSIKDFIRAYEQSCDAIYLNWVFFGNNGFVERASGSVLLNYTKRDKYVHPFTKTLTRASALDIPKIISEGQTGFWHDWGKVAGENLRRVNVLQDDMSGYYDDFPNAARSYLDVGDRQRRIFDLALIHHYAFRSEGDIERRLKRGIAADFHGQEAFKKVQDQGYLKGFLENFCKVEDTTLRNYWLGLLGGGWSSSLLPRPPGRNLSKGKPATQSSVSKWSRKSTPEEDAAGGVSGVFSGGFGFHTDQDEHPWWRVDLEDNCQIEQIRLFNRLGETWIMERASRLAIEVSLDDRAWQTVHNKTDESVFGGIDGSPLIWSAGETVIGRYVRVRLLRRQFLHLDQVEIWGSNPV